MKRFIIFYDKSVTEHWVWAENKKQARRQVSAFAKVMGFKILKIEEV